MKLIGILSVNQTALKWVKEQISHMKIMVLFNKITFWMITSITSHVYKLKRNHAQLQRIVKFKVKCRFPSKMMNIIRLTNNVRKLLKNHNKTKAFMKILLQLTFSNHHKFKKSIKLIQLAKAKLKEVSWIKLNNQCTLDSQVWSLGFRFKCQLILNKIVKDNQVQLVMKKWLCKRLLVHLESISKDPKLHHSSIMITKTQVIQMDHVDGRLIQFKWKEVVLLITNKKKKHQDICTL